MTEQVVLLDEQGRATGAAAKADAHHRHTPLHLAFSCYVFDDTGALLITQRALHKSTWPGAWTNSACGHPAPGEGIAEAVRRRTRQELGVDLRDLRLLLPDFRYQATMPDGMTENEMCPVFAAVSDGRLLPDPAEVADVTWEPWAEFRDAVVSGRRAVSPWCLAQVQQLATFGDDPGAWPEADWSDLPPAAR